MLPGTGTQERWTLVAKSGAVSGPPSLAGYTLLSVAGYAPEFVRHSALEAWALPADVKIESTGQILSALRRVASGEKVAALLDQTQAASLADPAFCRAAQNRHAISAVARCPHCRRRLAVACRALARVSGGPAENGTQRATC